ncbi:protein of unknown function [Candidatus Nitrotoga arctica]|uniref:Uncharacterized protein n=1 Tax=Candidatus Nitrotoga arctica TaxID=453162 RepID=A0ABM8YXM0_9PROT|nr:protein of unknown function [Candidatus Nitrotoga arctica]
MVWHNRGWTDSVKRRVIPPELRNTFTYHQAREMSKHVQLTERTGMAVNLRAAQPVAMQFERQY